MRLRGRDYQDIALGNCMVDHSIAHYVWTVSSLCSITVIVQIGVTQTNKCDHCYYEHHTCIIVYGEMVQYHTCPKGGVNV